LSDVTIRDFEPGDADGVDAVLRAAFPGTEEAQLVTALRQAGANTIDLVAEQAGRIVGMVMFSPAMAQAGDGETVEGLGLAPVAVDPQLQKSGIGKALIEAGLNQAKANGVPFVIVLGEPLYYVRFGFRPASARGWSWNADPEGRAGHAFQLLVFDAARTPGGAVAAYHPAFDAL
jgi:putative acetyltransferase